MVVWNRERPEPEDEARDARPDGSDQPSAGDARRPRPKDLITAQEAADLAGVARKTVDRRVRSGGLESWDGRRNGKKVRLVSRTEVLEAWPREGDAEGDSGGPDTSGQGRAPAPESVSSSRTDPAPEPARDAEERGGESTALVASVPVPVDVLSELRSRADRTELAETALADERAERRATLMALSQSQEKIRALLEGPDAAPVKADRRAIYAVAGVALVGFAVLGFTLRAVNSTAATYAAERDSAMGEAATVKNEAARLEGETDALRESLRDERQRSEVLADEVRVAEQRAEATKRAAEAAIAFDVMLRSSLDAVGVD